MTLSILADLVQHLKDRGQQPAIGVAGRPQDDWWDYRELHDRTRTMAEAIAAETLERNRPIGILGDNSPDWIATFLAIVTAGRIAMPVNALGSDEELQTAIQHSGCRHVFVGGAHVERFLELFGEDDLTLLRLEPDGEDSDATTALADAAHSTLPEISPDDVACLLYTSGTTGKPKGVPLSHGNLASNIQSMLDAEMAGSDDRVCQPLPMHHAYPLTVGALSPLACGATVILPERMSGRAIKTALVEESCTIMLGVPRLYEALLEALHAQLKDKPQLVSTFFQHLHAVASKESAVLGPVARELMAPVRQAFGPKLRMTACGGAKLDEVTERGLRGLGFEVLTGYGLTETSPIATFNPPGEARLGTAGKPVKDVSVRIDKEKEDDPSGVVWIKGPNVFRGYWGEDPADQEDLTAEGWYRTGDLGYLDDAGYLHLVGRHKEILVLAGGKNVVPDTVEQRFVDIDGLSEVAAIERDGRLELIVVLERGSGQGTAAEDHEETLRTRIREAAKDGPSYAQPSAIHVIRTPLPRTLIGKLKRHELEDVLAQDQTSEGSGDERLSPEDEALLQTPPAGAIYEWLKDRYVEQPVSLEASPQFDLGFDSFEWMNVALVLEERFEVALAEEELAEVETVRDLLSLAIDARGREPSGAHQLDERWLAPRDPASKAIAVAIRDSNRLMMRRYFELEIEGAAHIPADGPFVVTANHQSHLDSFALAAALPDAILERTYWAGATKIFFKGPLIRRFSRIANLLPIENDFGSFSALDYGRRVLERGDALVWYPEGHRSRDGKLLEFRPGVGVLMAELDVPALPLIIQGTREAMPAGQRLPRYAKLRLKFGAPVRAAELLGRAAEGDANEEGRAIVEALQGHIRSIRDA